MSLFEVKCPMCKGTLWIDPSTLKIVDHQSADHQKADFNEFMKNRNKSSAWDEKMKKAKDEDIKRKAEIEQKFKKAKEDGVEGTPEPHSPFDWD